MKGMPRPWDNGGMQEYARAWDDLRGGLLAFVRNRVERPSDADDIVQEVFLRVHEKAGQLRDAEKLQAWIYRIARNAVIDYYRSRGSARAEVASGDLEEAESREADQEELADQNINACVRGLLGALPPMYRDPLLMADVEGLSQKDIAERLGVSLSGAKSRVQRGREKLREVVEKCCHLEFDQYGNAVAQECRNPECGCCAAP